MHYSRRKLRWVQISIQYALKHNNSILTCLNWRRANIIFNEAQIKSPIKFKNCNRKIYDIWYDLNIKLCIEIALWNFILSKLRLVLCQRFTFWNWDVCISERKYINWLKNINWSRWFVVWVQSWAKFHYFLLLMYEYAWIVLINYLFFFSFF